MFSGIINLFDTHIKGKYDNKNKDGKLSYAKSQRGNMTARRRILKYLKGPLKKRFVFLKNTKKRIKAYTDLDYA